MQNKSSKIFLNGLYLFLIFFFAFSLLQTVDYFFQNWHLPWPSPNLAIDGPSFLKVLEDPIQVFPLKNLYHSPGYQYFVLFSQIIPFVKSFQAIKIAQGFLYLLSFILLFWNLKKGFNLTISLIGICFLGLSFPFSSYINLIQGEILQGFLLLSLFSLFHFKIRHPQKTSFEKLILGLTSIFLFFLIITQIRYLPLFLLLPFYSLFLLKKNILGTQWPFKIFLITFSLLFFWSLGLSLKKQKLVFISTGSEKRLNYAYNKNATGEAFPYPKIEGKSGLDFMLDSPGKVSKLIKNRFLYLFEFKKDIWHLGNPLNMLFWNNRDEFYKNEQFIYSSLKLLSFILGLYFLSIHNPIFTGLIFLFSFCILIGPLLVFASSRFLIPAHWILSILEASFVYFSSTRILKSLGISGLKS